MEQFQNDLLASVRQMKAGKAARVTAMEVSAATEARNRISMSPSEFAKLLGVSVRTSQDWLQGRREPSGAAKKLASHCVAEPGGSQGSGLSENCGLFSFWLSVSCAS